MILTCCVLLLTRHDRLSKVIMPKGGRRRRDPNKPKRGKSAFLLFSQYTRPAVIEEHPSMSFAELAKEVRSNHISKCKFDLDCALSPHFLPPPRPTCNRLHVVGRSLTLMRRR